MISRVCRTLANGSAISEKDSSYGICPKAVATEGFNDAESFDDRLITALVVAIDGPRTSPVALGSIFIERPTLGRDRSSARCLVTAATGGANLSVGDLVVQQGIQLGGLGGGVAEAATDGLDGRSGVDEFGGMGVAQLLVESTNAVCSRVRRAASNQTCGFPDAHNHVELCRVVEVEHRSDQRVGR